MKPLQGVPRPALADDSPSAVLARKLEAQLRTEFPNAFAGMVHAADGGFDVYSTGDPRLPVVVQQLQADSGGGIEVRVVTGMTNSLAVLERLHEQVRARNDDFKARGIVLGWGIDVRANRLRLEVVDLTAEKVAFLTTAFGAAQVQLVQGGFFAPSTKTSDSSRGSSTRFVRPVDPPA